MLRTIFRFRNGISVTMLVLSICFLCYTDNRILATGRSVTGSHRPKPGESIFCTRTTGPYQCVIARNEDIRSDAEAKALIFLTLLIIFAANAAGKHFLDKRK